MITLADAKYKIQDLECCDSCKNVDVDEDGCYTCRIIKAQEQHYHGIEWFDAVVEPRGICDYFENISKYKDMTTEEIYDEKHIEDSK